jgi:hypothetical protein
VARLPFSSMSSPGTVRWNARGLNIGLGWVMRLGAWTGPGSMHPSRHPSCIIAIRQPVSMIAVDANWSCLRRPVTLGPWTLDLSKRPQPSNGIAPTQFEPKPHSMPRSNRTGPIEPSRSSCLSLSPTPVIRPRHRAKRSEPPLSPQASHRPSLPDPTRFWTPPHSYILEVRKKSFHTTS